MWTFFPFAAESCSVPSTFKVIIKKGKPQETFKLKKVQTFTFFNNTKTTNKSEMKNKNVICTDRRELQEQRKGLEVMQERMENSGMRR